MNEYVSLEIAKIAKEKRFNTPCLYSYSKEGVLIPPDEELNKFTNKRLSDDDISAPTYQQLIEWIFEPCIYNENELGYKEQMKYLEFWYNTLIAELQDNEFVLEAFVGILINWFEKNGYYIINSKINGYYGYNFPYKDTIIMNNIAYSNKQQARHEGILKVFNLLKQDYEKSNIEN